MTRKNYLQTIKTKLIILFTVLCLIFSCIGLYACSDKDTTVTDPTYSVETEGDDVLIKNATFAINTANKDFTSFPITSPSNWGKATTENSSVSSTVNSGVIDVSEKGWETLVQTLYKDSDFIEYFKYLCNGYTQDNIISAIRTEKGNDTYTPTDTEIRDYAINTYINTKFVNPAKSPEADDDFVYMLNNVRKKDNLGFGTAQKLTSTSTVTLNKGAVYEISVWIKTENLKGFDNYGANIRLVNTINGKAQADYRISNIKDTEWTKYSIFVKADADYSCTLTLVLGLGYGNGDANNVSEYTEGTAFFDEITITELENFTETLTTDSLVYNSENKIEATLTDKTATHKACLYDMSFANSEASFFTSLPADLDNKFTQSNITVDNGAGAQVPLTSEIKVGAGKSTQTLTPDGDAMVMEVKKASATITVKDTSGSNFTLDGGKYMMFSFYVKNQLEGPASTNVYFDVIDVLGTETIKNAAAITVSEVSEEYVRYVILVKNNFQAGTIREFYFDIVVGPNDVASVVYDSDFATGKVYLKDLKNATGNIDNEDEIYDFFATNANATVALHAGFESDYTEDSASTSYKFATKPGNIGDIEENVTNPKDYAGIVPNHSYISGADGVETYTDTRSASGTSFDKADTGIAGLINTKYLSNYTRADDTNYGDEIKTKLGFNMGDDDMQVLMIKNNSANHYGFVGKKLSVTSGSRALVSVTLKVCDNATAYVYLSDISKTDKNVLTFSDFTVNTDVVNGVANGTNVDGNSLKYEIKVTKDMMKADGWATVNFYVGAGATAKSLRVEIWNGGRDGVAETASEGYVFVKSVTTSLSSGFTEGNKWNETFSSAGNPLYEAHKSSLTKLYAYERQLTETEIKYNAEYPDAAISYNANYVWAQNEYMVYGVYNTIDPVITDPYDSVEDEEETQAGCTATADPSTFWLSFSSILLAAVLLIAIVTLIVKKVVAKKKANKSDALSHYKVTSRISKPKAKKEKVVNEEPVEKITEVEETTTEEIVEEETTTEENSEEYIYGEVESFGEETEKKDN